MHDRRPHAVAVVLTFLGSLVVCGATRAALGAEAPAGDAARATLAESLGTIEPRDLLRVSVSGLAGPGVATVRLVRVDGEGAARLPYVGAVKLAGLSAARAERAVVDAYRDARVLRPESAVVEVRRVEAGSRAGGRGGAIGNGDLLAVTIEGLTGPNRAATFVVRVGADGAAALPLIGAVPVAGAGESKAADAVAAALLSQKLLPRPEVGVRVLETAAEAKVKLGPVGKGDLLEIEIWELIGQGRRTRLDVRVGEDGAVAVPLAGAVKLAGASEAAAGEAVARAYRDAGLIRSALTLVRRVQSADRADVKLGAIAKGDVLRLTVGEVSGPSSLDVRHVLVGADGAVPLPLIEPLKVEGLTEAAASAAVAKAYRDQKVLQNAIVSVLKVNGGAALSDEEAGVETARCPEADAPADPPAPPARKRR